MGRLSSGEIEPGLGDSTGTAGVIEILAGMIIHRREIALGGPSSFLQKTRTKKLPRFNGF